MRPGSQHQGNAKQGANWTRDERHKGSASINKFHELGSPGHGADKRTSGPLPGEQVSLKTHLMSPTASPQFISLRAELPDPPVLEPQCRQGSKNKGPTQSLENSKTLISGI
jgi:hypothetical protein